jgi:hypothetical protein
MACGVDRPRFGHGVAAHGPERPRHPTPLRPGISGAGGQPLIWDEKAFSVLLEDSAADVEHRHVQPQPEGSRNDFALGAALVERFERNVPRRTAPYPAESANDDLALLRGARQLVLMPPLP